uniref:ER lumen protein-retaining receptor n=1 Tax=Ciona savignyi TaxID=51511 RepID=H2Z3D7_CIOSA
MYCQVISFTPSHVKVYRVKHNYFTVWYLLQDIQICTSFFSWYNTIYKVVFIALSILTSVLIYVVYKKTYDKLIDSFQVLIVIVPSIICGYSFSYDRSSIRENFWAFSIFLECVAILPQLYMIYQTGEAKTITMHYLIPLGMYRALYIGNWIWRYYYNGYYEPVALGCGIIQTILYILFVTMPIFWSGTKVDI